MFKKYKWIIYTRPFTRAAYGFAMLYLRTIQLDIKNYQNLITLLEQGNAVLICAWHQQFFSLIRYFKIFRKYNPAIMISQSRDGELISRIAQWVGWKTVRGSSSKGGKTAMHEIIAHMKTHRLAAHILDGPRGPVGRVKPGAVKIALDSQALVIPLYVIPENAWFFKSWDQFMLPKPFSKVTIFFEKELKFASCSSDKEFELHRLQLENILKKRLILKYPV